MAGLRAVLEHFLPTNTQHNALPWPNSTITKATHLNLGRAESIRLGLSFIVFHETYHAVSA